ncbi:hypothetical protein QJQ45_017626 [Haematococcus lacustris]|nr:hypothetical protein QJQ45_017626 [Haematococcus lacustris]
MKITNPMLGTPELQPDLTEADRNRKPVYTDIPVSQAAIPDLSCRNLFLQLCRGPPGNGAHTRPNAAVAAVLAAHPDLRDRLAAIPRHPSDSNMVDHVGKQLETAFSNMLTLLFAGRLKKSVSLAGAKVLVGTEEHRRRFGFWGVGGGYLPAWSKRECTYVRRMVCGLDVSWLLEQGGVVPTPAMQAEVALQRGLLGLEEGELVDDDWVEDPANGAGCCAMRLRKLMKCLGMCIWWLQVANRWDALLPDPRRQKLASPKHSFAQIVHTDGVALSVMFLRPKPAAPPADPPRMGRHMGAVNPLAHLDAEWLGVDPGKTNMATVAHEERSAAGTVVSVWQRSLTADSCITRQAQATKKWLAQVKPQLNALSHVSSKPSSLASYRRFADTVLATYDAMWAEVSKPRWANAKFRLYCGKQRVVARFLSKLIKQAKQRWPDRVLALDYGAAGFSGSGNIGCRGVPVSQMLKEAVKQFGAGRVVMVDEFRTSRVSSAYSSPSEALPGQPPESFRFYDRDVSAALNIRRCAVGPGPRPTELCYWDGRPAMPKQGRPGQEWQMLRHQQLRYFKSCNAAVPALARSAPSAASSAAHIDPARTPSQGPSPLSSSRQTSRHRCSHVTASSAAAELPVPSSSAGSSSFSQAVLNVVNVMMGVGLLSLPFALKSSGWIGIALLWFMGIVTNYTGKALVECANAVASNKGQPGSVVGYEEIAEASFGPLGKALVSAIIYVELFGTCCLLFILEGDNMYSLLGNMLASSASQYMLIAAAIMIPTVWLPDLSALSFLGVFGVTATTTVVASVLYTLVTGNFTAGALTHNALPATLPLVFGIMTFCYSGHGVFPAIQASMKEPQLFPKVLNVAFFLVAFLCTFIAAAGYYMYGAGAADIVIFNLPTLLATACSCLVLINPVAKFALTMEPVAAAANVAAGAGRPLTGLPRLAVRTALSLAILMAARSLPFLAHLMALVGSFMTISVSVTLPALCHLILLKGKLGTAKVSLIFMRCCEAVASALELVCGAFGSDLHRGWYHSFHAQPGCQGISCGSGRCMILAHHDIHGLTPPSRHGREGRRAMLQPSPSEVLQEEATRKALLVKKLERQADDEHKQAQRFNKAGRFEEAQAAYSRMHQLEDEATALAKEIGCVACILGDPSCAANTSPLSQEEQDAYFVLHPPAPWPSDVASLPHTVQAALQRASGGDSLIPGSVASNSPSHCLPLTVEVLADRAQGSVLGSLVADAAAMGVHWVYDLNLMQQLERETVMARSLSRSMASMNLDLAPASASGSEPASVGLSQANLHSLSSISLVDAGGVSSGGLLEQDSWHSTTSCDEGLEFLNPPRSPFYAYASGRNSPYGEQTLVLLRSLAARQGLDCCSYALAFQDYFGDKFDGYRDVSTKGFLRAFARGQVPPATGAPDAQANCIARLAPLVAAWAGSAGLVPAVRRATRVTQNSDEACSWGAAGAAILEAVLLGALPSAAVQAVAEELEWGTVAAAAAAAVPKGVEDGETGTAPGAVDTPAEESPHIASSGASSRLEVTHELAGVIAGNLRHAMKLAALPPSTAIAELGRNCHMPNALTSPLQIVLHMEHRARCSITPSAPGSAAVAAVAGAMQTMYAEAVRLAIREGPTMSLFKKKPEISNISQVKSSVARGIRSSICEQYPSLEESGAIDLLIPKKEPLLLGKCEGHVQIAILNNVPLFFQERDGHWCPTLRVLHQYPDMMKKLRADKGAIKFVLSGANIMCPGLTSPGATLHDEVPAETPVAIYAEGKEHAMAIGYTKMSTADMKTINKGIAVDNLHYLNDGLWKQETLE